MRLNELASPALAGELPSTEEPVLLLVTEDQQLREDISLIAAVVGVRLEACARWSGITDQVADSAVAVLCCPQSTPRTTALAQRCLLVGHDAEAVWAAAAETPGLAPVPLPAAEKWLTEHLSAQVLDRAQGRVIAVAGATGGVGVTTFAYICAAELAIREYSPMLIDAAGGTGRGIADLVCAARRQHSLSGGELDWKQLTAIEGEISAAHLREAVPVLDGIGVLTGTTASRVQSGRLNAAVVAARRAYDVVLIDIGHQAETLAGLGENIDELMVVTRASRRGADAAEQLINAVPQHRPHLVVNGLAAPGWSAAEVQEALGAQVVADLPVQKWLARNDDIAEAYELLRTRRGSALVGAVLSALGADDA
ncbi:hypothetical protein [Nesterenkonia ebinurensis]|uniref:hypothetical protein n=1 Tax=Nesterenkonia ebinurensis TaxID=2608252 RepID=UPI00168ACBEA|nr:hypothetical protein [Nesterenkonia ebinurensis]